MPIRLTTVACVLALAGSLGAQQSDTARPPQGAFLGRITASSGKAPVHGADLRLLFIDSARTIQTKDGRDSLQMFFDNARSRVAVTDSTGAFSIWRLLSGHYLLQVRRIGYEPIQAVVTTDTTTLYTDLTMPLVSQLLATVVIRENAVDMVKDRLGKVGYQERSNSGLSATFIDRQLILKHKPQTIADMLAVYGITDCDCMIDHIPIEFDMLKNYSAELVIGIEVYRNNRPTEYNGTRNGPTIFAPGGQAALMKALVLVWTFIP